MKGKSVFGKAAIVVIATVMLLATSVPTIALEYKASHSILSTTYQILWRQQWADGDHMSTKGGKSIVDGNNNIITWVDSAAYDKTYLTKYDTNGNQLWMWEINLDDLENITSYDLNEGGQGGEMRSGTPEGPVIGILQQETDDNSWFTVVDVKTDSLNNIILMINHVVSFQDPQIVNTDIFKYNPNGEALWKCSYTYDNYLTTGIDMAISPDGYSIYVPCLTLIGGGYILKLDSYDGAVDWFDDVKILPFWYPMSIVIDGNSNPLVSSLDCMTDPNSPTVLIGLTTLNKNNGAPVADAMIEVPLEGSLLHDAALAIDNSNHHVYFGLWGYLHCVDAGYNIDWSKQVPSFINDVKIVGNKIATAGGWCTVGDETDYYAGYYDKNTGATILDMALGEILFCIDPAFQPYFNQLQSISIDNQGNMIFSGGEGGMVIIKVHISTGIQIAQLFQNQALE